MKQFLYGFSYFYMNRSEYVLVIFSVCHIRATSYYDFFFQVALHKGKAIKKCYIAQKFGSARYTFKLCTELCTTLRSVDNYGVP